MTTYTFETNATASSTPRRVEVATGRAAVNAHGPVVEVPASQLYYWSRVWQANERVATAELERGEGLRFDDPMDAVRWLLSSEDE